MWYVYIALLDNGDFYTGHTSEAPAQRIASHRSGSSKFTRGRKIVRLLWYEARTSLSSAVKRERQLKGWSHAKKQALIDGDFAKLRALAKSKRSQSQS